MASVEGSTFVSGADGRVRLAERGFQASQWLAILIAAMATGLAIRFNTFTPYSTDAAAYVESAHRWGAGRLIEPSPIPLWASWSRDGELTSPHAFRPGPSSGTDVVEYPAGLPILMAAAILFVGDFGPYLVAPLSFGLLVLSVFVVASRLAGPFAGVIASTLAAASPVTFVSAVQPMSDVPAVALWMLAWAMSLRPGNAAVVAAGAASAVAVMVRPNLGLFVVLIAANTLVSAARTGSSRWRAAAIYVGFVSIGVAILLWTQAVLYGSALTSGYKNPEALFAWSHVRTNLMLHSGHLKALHSFAVILGLVTPLFLSRALPELSFSTELVCQLPV